jgi:hypothetical protein
MSYIEYLRDKIHKHQPEQSGESNCCGAPVIDDYLICSDCKESCDYRQPLCKFCGEEFPEWEEDGFCSDNCWNGYASETFYDD